MPKRTTPRTTPGGSRRPGSRAASARTRAASATSEQPTSVTGTAVRGAVRETAGASREPGGRPRGRRPRFTGRMGVLLLVLAVLAVSYASSLRAYLHQRELIDTLSSDITEREQEIAALEREKERWEDPAYVRSQARARFGYLMPGQTGFQVLDADGNPLDGRAGLHDPDEVVKETPTPWWEEAWSTVELAGNPPPPEAEPVEMIDGVKVTKRAEKQAARESGR